MFVRIVAVLAALVVAGSAYLLARPPGPAADQVASVPTMTPPATEAVEQRPPRQQQRRNKRPSPAPTATPTPAPRTFSPASAQLGPAEQRVALRLAKLVPRSPIRDNVGVAVLTADGQPIYHHRATTPVLPASTQKLAVAGAALARFGPAHRYTTTVTTTAQPDARGVIRGDLVVVGGGDPTLAQPTFAAIEPDRPRTPLEDLVRQVKAAGVRRVTGRVLADPSYFADEPVAVGWRGRYFDQLDATRITGLTVDAGRRIYRANGGLQADAARDPAQQTATIFRRLLRGGGITVDGTATVTTTPVPGPTLATVTSPPLATLLRYMVQSSDNHMADMIFRTIGAADGDGTWIGAAGSAADVLAPLQLDWSGVVLADGSGLSRANRVSVSFLAQLQSRMMQSNLRDQWIPLLALSGERGTLRSRFVGTVAEQRVYGKTGSLRDVSALVGTVAGTQGRHLHFAIVGNGLSSSTTIRTLTDAAVLAIAEEIQDCRRVVQRAKGKQRPNKPKRTRLVCG